MIRSRSTRPSPIRLRTSVRLPIERSGAADCRFSARIPPARSPLISRVFGQASGSLRVFENTAFGRSFIPVLTSSAADDEIAARASYVTRPMTTS